MPLLLCSTLIAHRHSSCEAFPKPHQDFHQEVLFHIQMRHKKISRAEGTYSLYLNLPILNANKLLLGQAWCLERIGCGEVIFPHGTWATFFHENSFASSTAESSGSTVVITRAAMIYKTNLRGGEERRASRRITNQFQLLDRRMLLNNSFTMSSQTSLGGSILIK